MRRLIGDANSRIRLIAASCLLPIDPGDARAGAVLLEALGDPVPRIRKAALDLVASLGTGGAAFLEGLKERGRLEADAEVRASLAPLLERLVNQAGADPAQSNRGLSPKPDACR